jgi:hypothetical protein
MLYQLAAAMVAVVVNLSGHGVPRFKPLFLESERMFWLRLVFESVFSKKDRPPQYEQASQSLEGLNRRKPKEGRNCFLSLPV